MSVKIMNTHQSEPIIGLTWKVWNRFLLVTRSSVDCRLSCRVCEVIHHSPPRKAIKALGHYADLASVDEARKSILMRTLQERENSWESLYNQNDSLALAKDFSVAKIPRPEIWQRVADSRTMRMHLMYRVTQKYFLGSAPGITVLLET
jgi:hypothetical protein